MRNPIRGEADAFRLVLMVVAAIVPVALAAALGPGWLALALLGAVLAILAVTLLRMRALRRRRVELLIRSAPAHVGGPDERRVLVVANDTLEEAAFIGELQRLASLPHTHVLVLAPAIISRSQRVTGAIDRELQETHARLQSALAHLGHGLDAHGEVSDADPLTAVEDCFATFAPDEVIVCTQPEQPWHGLEPRLAGLLRARCAVPVRHLVLGPGLERHASPLS